MATSGDMPTPTPWDRAEQARQARTLQQQQLGQFISNPQPPPFYYTTTGVNPTATSTWPGNVSYSTIPQGYPSQQQLQQAMQALTGKPIDRADAARWGVQKDATYDPFKPLYLTSGKFNTYLAIRNVRLRLM